MTKPRRTYLYTMWLMTLCLLTTACDLHDHRDDCCEENVMIFRYLLKNTDCFADYITTMRYYLFDGQGRYLKPMTAMNGDLTRVDLSSLASGYYTIVAIGNLDDYATISDLYTDDLADAALTVDDLYEGSMSRATSDFANGDPIYWGQCDFGIVSGQSNYYRTEMANVHCTLTVRIEWESLPPYGEGYTYSLTGIGTAMELSDQHATTIGVQSFPQVSDYTGTMLEDVTMRRLALEASLITLRYTDADMPTFQLYHDGEAQIPDVDLTTVFSQWGWKPSSAAVQEYEILITILSNGDIEISDSLSGTLNDWTDGGSIG